MVYVIAKNGHPLMPTERYGKVRRMLKSGRAKVTNRCPFTVQLLYSTTEITQPVEVGDDAGYKHNGISAVAVYPNGKEIEVYRSEVIQRTDVVGNLATRRENRRTRRNRKTRYRQPRFNNRRRGDGWLAPSVQNKIGSHTREIEFVCSILPVTKVTIETASFDLQKLKADWNNLLKPEGEDYRHGEQYGFWNAREYVLFRDGHTCQCCKGKTKDKRLNVHHIERRKTGGDAPNNLITLCETCHTGYHKRTVQLPKTIKRGMSFKEATFMGIMRWAFFNKVKESLVSKGIKVHMTYGYITKNTRISHNLEKSHCIDALCISGHPDAKQLDHYFYKKKVRCHNRQIHKNTILKSGVRKRNQAPYIVKGFRLFDKVSYKGQECFIFGRRLDGRFAIRKADGTKINEQLSYKKLKFIDTRKYIICERRTPLLIGASPDVPAAV